MGKSSFMGVMGGRYLHRGFDAVVGRAHTYAAIETGFSRPAIDIGTPLTTSTLLPRIQEVLISSIKKHSLHTSTSLTQPSLLNVNHAAPCRSDADPRRPPAPHPCPLLAPAL